MNNSKKLKIINQTLTKLYNQLKEDYHAVATLTIVNAIKELEILKVALEAEDEKED